MTIIYSSKDRILKKYLLLRIQIIKIIILTHLNNFCFLKFLILN